MSDLRRKYAVMAALLAIAFIAACSAGGSIPYGSPVPAPVPESQSTPLVLSMGKTSNASLSPGMITITVAMSEALATAPQAVSVQQGSTAVVVSESAGTSYDCSLLDEGMRVACEIQVAGCNDSTDYIVTISGGENAAGVLMEPYVMLVNSSDSEWYDENEPWVCWTAMPDPDPSDPEEFGFEGTAELGFLEDSLVWDLLVFPSDMAQASIFKTFYGYDDLAVSIMVDTGPTLGEAGVAITGMQFNSMAAPLSLSEGYRMLLGGLVGTTYTDDATGSIYAPTGFDIMSDQPMYYCMVKDFKSFSYYFSTDGMNFTQLSSENMDFAPMDEGVPYLVTPIDAGWECPEDPAVICNTDADWDSEMAPFRSYEECVAAAEAFFTDEICNPDYGEAGLLYLYPIFRIFSWGSPELDMPPLDYVRFRVTGISGVAADCPTFF